MNYNFCTKNMTLDENDIRMRMTMRMKMTMTMRIKKTKNDFF